LLSVIRDSLEDMGFTDQADGLHKLIERENIENQKEFVLQTQTSYPYFQDQVLSRGSSELRPKLHQEEERIQKAHQQFGILIDSLAQSFHANLSLSAKKRIDKIREALIGIRNSLLALKLILITLDSEDDA